MRLNEEHYARSDTQSWGRASPTPRLSKSPLRLKTLRRMCSGQFSHLDISPELCYLVSSKLCYGTTQCVNVSHPTHSTRGANSCRDSSSVLPLSLYVSPLKAGCTLQTVLPNFLSFGKNARHQYCCQHEAGTSSSQNSDMPNKVCLRKRLCSKIDLTGYRWYSRLVVQELGVCKGQYDVDMQSSSN